MINELNHSLTPSLDELFIEFNNLTLLNTPLDYSVIQCKSTKLFQNINKMNTDIDTTEWFNTIITTLKQGDNIYLKLSFLFLVQSKVIPEVIVEKYFIDNSRVCQTIIDIFKIIYWNNVNDLCFEVPSVHIFVNYVLKLPDILNNFFNHAFINSFLFYSIWFSWLTLKHNVSILKFNGITDKIYQLKLHNYIYSAVLEEGSPHSKDEIREIIDIIINTNELLRGNYTKTWMCFGYVNEKDFYKLIEMYNCIDRVDDYGRVDKIIRKNPEFISLVLASCNKDLKKKYFQDLILLLKDRTKIIAEEIEEYEFYCVFLSMFIIMEEDESGRWMDIVAIFDGWMKIVLIVLEIVNSRAKKGTVKLFMKYLSSRMKQYLKEKRRVNGDEAKGDWEDKEENDDDDSVFNQEEKGFLDFKNNMTMLNGNKMFLHKVYSWSQRNFYSLYVDMFTPSGMKSKVKSGNSNEINDKEEPKKQQSKIKYRSIKYQKKHNIPIIKPRELLELSNTKDTSSEILNDELKLPVMNSSWKISLVQNDTFSDLKPMNTPWYIKDCILGLQSQFKDRQELSLNSLLTLIDSQPWDLEFSLNDWTITLLKISNSFDIANFDDLIESNLIKLTKLFPNQVTQILCERFFSDDNCGWKYKFMILNIITKAIDEILNISDSRNSYSSSARTSKVNKFHPYFNNIVFPLLLYLKKKKIQSLIVFEGYDWLWANFMFWIGRWINVSENHPVIYKALFESFELFKAVIEVSELKNKTHSLIEGLNYYVNVTLNFYNKNFVLNYPELLSCVRIGVSFWNNLLDDKQWNDDWRWKILSTLDKYTVQSDAFKESYFGGCDNGVNNSVFKIGGISGLNSTLGLKYNGN